MSTKFLLTLIVLVSLSLGCDKIDHPVEASYSFDTSLFPGPGEYEIPTFGPYPTAVKNVLIEDFTGHLCPSCPFAAETAHTLKEEHDGRVVVASIHAGPPGSENFQRVLVEGESGYPGFQRDFRTVAGETYSEDINTLTANPSGLINRTPPTSTITNLYTGSAIWPTLVNNIFTENEPLEVNLQVLTNYYPSTRGLFVHVQSTTLVDTDRAYFIVAYLIDDEIIDWQKDGETYLEDYIHRDVLVDNINGTYGQKMYTSANASAGDTFQHDYSYEIPSSIDDSGLSIIAYIMDFETFEIMQVVEHPID